MKAIFFILLILSVFASWRTSATNKQIEALEQSKGWSGIIVQLAELHTEVGGPVEELIQAIEKVVEDLETQLENAHASFAERTSKHDLEVERLDSAILKAKSDFNGAQDDLDNVLIPLQQHLLQQIANDQKLIQDTSQAIKSSNAKRETENGEFNEKSQQLNEAIKLLEECLSLLDELRSQSLSLVQTSNAAKVFEQNAKKLDQMNLAETKIAEVLTQLAMSQEFTDQSALNKVISLISDSKANLNNTLTQIAIDERQSIEDHKNFVQQSKTEIKDAQNRISENNITLKQTIQNIENTQAYIQKRKLDEIAFNGELEEENDAYEEYTKLYNTKVEQIESEISGCKQAVAIINNGQISQYIKSRVDYQPGQGNVLKAHGTGVDVMKKYDSLYAF